MKSTLNILILILFSFNVFAAKTKISCEKLITSIMDVNEDLDPKIKNLIREAESLKIKSLETKTSYFYSSTNFKSTVAIAENKLSPIEVNQLQLQSIEKLLEARNLISAWISDKREIELIEDRILYTALEMQLPPLQIYYILNRRLRFEPDVKGVNRLKNELEMRFPGARIKLYELAKVKNSKDEKYATGLLRFLVDNSRELSKKASLEIESSWNKIFELILSEKKKIEEKKQLELSRLIKIELKKIKEEVKEVDNFNDDVIMNLVMLNDQSLINELLTRFRIKDEDFKLQLQFLIFKHPSTFSQLSLKAIFDEIKQIFLIQNLELSPKNTKELISFFESTLLEVALNSQFKNPIENNDILKIYRDINNLQLNEHVSREFEEIFHANKKTILKIN